MYEPTMDGEGRLGGREMEQWAEVIADMGWLWFGSSRI